MNSKKDISLKKALWKFPQVTLDLVTDEKTGEIKTDKVMKTMQSGLAINLSGQQKRRNIEELSIEKKKMLDEYIDTFEHKKQLILEDFYRYYEKSIVDFLIYCARIKDTSATTYTVIPDLPEIETKVKKSDGTCLKVRAHKGMNNKTGNPHATLYWFAYDNDTIDGCTKVQFEYTGKKEIEVDGKKKTDFFTIENYSNSFFDSDKFELKTDPQQIGNRISFFYITGAREKNKNGVLEETKAYKKYLASGVIIKGIADDMEFKIGEQLRAKVASVITSFLSKLQDSIEKSKTLFQKKEQRFPLPDSSSKDEFILFLWSNLRDNEKQLLDELREIKIHDGDIKKFAEQYNALVKGYNQILNNSIQAYVSMKLLQARSENKRMNKEQKEKSLREMYGLDHMKGVPSFPQMKDKLKAKVTPDILSEFIIDSLKKYPNFSAFGQLLLDEADFTFTDQTGKLSDNIAEQEEQIREKWEKIKGSESTSFILTLRKMFWRRDNIPGKKLMYYTYYLIDKQGLKEPEIIIKSLIDFALRKILRKKDHLLEEKFVPDQKTKREFCDYARLIISLIAYQLKKEGQGKTARALELEIDDYTGRFKGTAFDLLKKEESHIIPISGFDFDQHGTDSGACLVFRNTQERTYWYLALNLYEKIHFEKNGEQFDRPSMYLADKYFVLASKKTKNNKAVHQVFYLSEKELSPSSKTILVPLMIGKRQLREYFTNFDTSAFNNLLCFNSAEIQRLRDNNKEKYFLNLVTTKPELQVRELISKKRNGLIGVDRGENTVAWAALTDNQGNPLFGENDARNFIQLAAQFGKKFREEYKTTAANQSLGSTKKLNVQGRIKKVIEDAGATIVSKALEHGLQIVLENLDSGFGRQGKNTFVGVRQFTHLRTFIESKLSQNSILYKKDGILQTVPAAYTSKMCSNCGNINSLKGKEFFIDGVMSRFKDNAGGSDVNISSNGLTINLNQQIKSWDRNKKLGEREVKENAYHLIQDIFSNPKIKKHEERIEVILKKLLYPRKKDSALYECNFCDHVCDADQQAALNIARFSILPFRTKDEKTLVTSIEKLEHEYKKRLNSGEFLTGKNILRNKTYDPSFSSK